MNSSVRCQSCAFDPWPTLAKATTRPTHGCATIPRKAGAARMKRRQFITLVGATVVSPLAAQSQQPKVPVRIGFLFFGSPSNTYDRSLVESFRQGLNEVGLLDGRDILFDVEWTSDNPDQAVTDLLQRGAELLVPSGSTASVAANRLA